MIKLGVLGILFENDLYFTNILEKTISPYKSFENFIEAMAKPHSWGDEICEIAISILLNRPLNVYSIDPANNIPYSHEYCILKDSYGNSPINIAFISNHFCALMPKKSGCQTPKPIFNQFITRFNLIKSLN